MFNERNSLISCIYIVWMYITGITDVMHFNGSHNFHSFFFSSVDNRMQQSKWIRDKSDWTKKLILHRKQRARFEVWITSLFFSVVIFYCIVIDSSKILLHQISGTWRMNVLSHPSVCMEMLPICVHTLKYANVNCVAPRWTSVTLHYRM